MLYKKYHLITLLCTILLGVSCSRQGDEQTMHCINFPEAIKNVSEIMLSEYVSSIKYTPIETHDSALLGNIDHFFTTNDSLMFITSPELQRCIHIFTRDGKYIKDIGAKGNGPGEYRATKSMTVIPKKNALFVEGGPKAVIYSLNDGKYISERWVTDFFDNSKDTIIRFKGRETMVYNMMAGNIVYHNNHVYATAGDCLELDLYFIKMDMNFSLDTIIPMRKSTLSIGSTNIVGCYSYLYDDKISVVHGLQDTIYTWENESLIPRILINFGDIPSVTTMPQIKKTDPIFHPRTTHMHGKFAKIWFGRGSLFAETDNFITGTVLLPVDIVESKKLRRMSEFLYDKKTRKTRIIKPSCELKFGAFTNDIDGGMPFWPTKQIGNKLYQFVDAGTFIKMSEKYNSPRMKEIAATLTEQSNPVMIEATLK